MQVYISLYLNEGQMGDFCCDNSSISKLLKLKILNATSPTILEKQLEAYLLQIIIKSMYYLKKPLKSILYEDRNSTLKEGLRNKIEWLSKKWINVDNY